MIAWEEYYPGPKTMTPELKTKTDVACPKCGKALYRRNDIVLTSNPPQRQYECDCGFVGYRFQ